MIGLVHRNEAKPELAEKPTADGYRIYSAHYYILCSALTEFLRPRTNSAIHQLGLAKLDIQQRLKQIFLGN